MQATPTAERKAKKYPFMAFRPSKPLEKRIRRIAKLTNRKLAAIVHTCVMAELPKMEAEAAKKKVA